MFQSDNRTVSTKALTKAEEFAQARINQNGGNDTAAYRGHMDRLPLDNLQSNTFALVGEFAVADELGLDKNLIEWVIDRSQYQAKGLKKNADLRWTHPVTGVEWRFEVRNATKPGSPLPIKAKDNQDNLIVLQVYVQPDVKAEWGKPVRGVSKPTGHVSYLGWRYGSEYKDAKAKAGTYYALVKYDIDSLAEALGEQS